MCGCGLAVSSTPEQREVETTISQYRKNGNGPTQQAQLCFPFDVPLIICPSRVHTRHTSTNRIESVQYALLGYIFLIWGYRSHLTCCDNHSCSSQCYLHPDLRMLMKLTTTPTYCEWAARAQEVQQYAKTYRKATCI